MAHPIEKNYFFLNHKRFYIDALSEADNTLQYFVPDPKGYHGVVCEHGGDDAHNVEAGILHPWPDEDCLPVDVNVDLGGRPQAVGAPIVAYIDPGGQLSCCSSRRSFT